MAAPGQLPCLRLLHLPVQQRMPTSLPHNPTTRIIPIPTSPETSIEVPMPTPPVQTPTIPMRSPSLLAKLHSRRRSQHPRRMSASNSNTIAMARGTTISNTKLRGSNQQLLRRWPLLMRHSSTRNKRSNSNRARHERWLIQLLQARRQGTGQLRRRFPHISALEERRSPQAHQHRLGRQTITTRLLERGNVLVYIFFFFPFYSC